MSAFSTPSGSSMDAITLIEKVTSSLSSHNYDATTQDAIKNLSALLKQHGAELESSHRPALDNLQQVLRFACRDNTLDLVSRVLLLEIIELRAMKWVPSDHVTTYYSKKLKQINTQLLEDPRKCPVPSPSLQPKCGANSGLNANAPEFTIPQARGNKDHSSSEIPRGPPSIALHQPPLGKKKASDKEKENKECSENETKEDGGKIGMNTFTFKTKDGEVTISSFNEDLLRRAQVILKEKLAEDNPEEKNKSEKSIKCELTYDRKELLELATSPLCSVAPFDWEKITSQVPDMVKSTIEVGKEMSELAKRPRLQ